MGSKVHQVACSQIENWLFEDFNSNPVQAVAKGKPVFSLWVMPWADDVSGNWSKQYNLHINVYMKNLNVPSKKLK